MGSGGTSYVTSLLEYFCKEKLKIVKKSTVRELDYSENNEEYAHDALDQAVSQVFFRIFIGYRREFFCYEKK